VVIGMQDFVRRKSHEDALAFEAAFNNSAKEFEALHVPFLLEGVANVSELNLKDGIDPNKKGQTKRAKQKGPRENGRDDMEVSLSAALVYFYIL